MADDRLRAFKAAVERAGGTWSISKDGHVKVFARSGRFVMKIRTHSLASQKDRKDRAIQRQVLRRVVRE